MRLLLAGLVTILVGGFLGFLAGNLETTVPVTLFGEPYPAVPLWLVVLAALAIMFVLISTYAIAEGAAMRLENRRLKRELHKLETEINYLRTQPRNAVEPLPAPPTSPGADTTVPRTALDAGNRPPSAPVYDNTDSDSDDDIYTGGRAV